MDVRSTSHCHLASSTWWRRVKGKVLGPKAEGLTFVAVQAAGGDQSVSNVCRENQAFANMENGQMRRRRELPSMVDNKQIWSPYVSLLLLLLLLLLLQLQ